MGWNAPRRLASVSFGLLSLSLAACGGAAAEVTSPRAVSTVTQPAQGGVERSAPAALADPVPAYLADVEAALPAERVLLRRAGQVRLALEGAPVAAEKRSYPLDMEPSLAVAAEAADAVRVVSTWGSARLLLWAGRQDLATVAVREAMLEGGAPPRGVTLRVGGPIEVVERGEGRVRVRRADSDVAFEGWVAADAIGQVFRPAPEAESLPSFGNGSLSCRTELAATPGGEPVAILAPKDTGACKARVAAAILSEARAGGQVEVALQRSAYLVRGFVSSVAVDSEDEVRGYGTLYGIGGGGSGDGVPEVVLPAGTCLFAERYGEPVGVVTRSVVFARGDEPAERSWVAGAVETLWGDVSVWAFVESASEDRWRRCE